MKKTLLLLLISLQSLGQKGIFEYDNSGKINVDWGSKISEVNKYRISNELDNVLIEIQPDTLFPENRTKVTINFPISFDLASIRFLVLTVYFNNAINPPNSTYLTSSRAGSTVYLGPNSIDFANRKMEVVLGGLKPRTEYLLKSSYFVSNCSGGTFQDIVFETAEEPQSQLKKVLLIIDKDYEYDSEINIALDNYITNNLKYYKHLRFEKYYLNTSNLDRNVLYNKIKAEHLNRELPLKYLFFIGSNSGNYTRRIRLDPNNNQVQNEYASLSMNFYAQVSLPEYVYNSVTDVFDNIGYQYCNYTFQPLNDISAKVIQSNFYDIAYGSLMPNGLMSNKNSILSYFVKLNAFKSGLLTFDKSVLFADTQRHDGESPTELARLNARWLENDTINVSQKLEFGIGNSGSYPAWTQDYLNKLSQKSYEICTYMGHGGPGIHYFNVTASVLNNLPSLNVMLFDFNSCNVGFFFANSYLAGSYLDAGNTLFVKAYTNPIGIITFNNKSPLIDFFRKNEVFHSIERKMFFGDSFLYNLGGDITQIQLGDPLLQLDPPCTLDNLTLLSPNDDYLNQRKVALRQTVNASNKIFESENIEFSAGRKILLEPGFEVSQGSIFLAKIDGCEN
jgi:hypothetical protein